ncbi:hypothetical protein DUI87_24562 [Hirundo rustica rustica]|uniref:RING-type E3 ubiquitin transferase n=1 Tax=Hirundo rustica rustica TaxID=333673 RepID=A0A3M0JVN8_HIRRU|nr:hypothetical protein DUI87_24562 [Hirundo rustica rustica]
MEGTAAEGSGSPSQDPPSTPQHRGSTDTEVEDRCPICLEGWREPSLVMPCQHCFCHACILQRADNKTQCPLCKGKMTFISVRADDDFEEHVIIPPMTAPGVLPAEGAHREPDAPNLQCPRAHQQWATAGDVQHFVGGFQLPNWMSCLSANSVVQQTLHLWFCQSLEMLFETATSRAQHTRVPEQQRCREDHHLPCQWDTRGATGQEDSSSSLTPGPARSSVDEMPCTSSSALGCGPGIHPSDSTTIHVEQDPLEESERLCPGPPNSIRGSDPSPRGPQRP